MEIKQIESFYWANKLGSFSAAAQYLNTTQPNISARIQSLERELRTLLFDRSARQIHLTVAGRQLIHMAENVIVSISEMQKRAKGDATLTGRITLGVSNTVGQTWLPTFISLIQRNYPDVNVDFYVDTNASLMSLFFDHEIDLLICTEKIQNAGVVSDYLFRTRFEWVASPDMRFESQPVTVKELTKCRLITLPAGSYLQKVVFDYLRERGATADRVSCSNSVAAMLNLVAERSGICAVPELIASSPMYANLVRPMEVEHRLPDIDFYMTHVDDQLNRSLPLLASLAREAVKQWQEGRSISEMSTHMN